MSAKLLLLLCLAGLFLLSTPVCVTDWECTKYCGRLGMCWWTWFCICSIQYSAEFEELVEKERRIEEPLE
ncbi:unnamed protein product [Bursaphelenchus xylophilus]|uniref:(pine wood nematode) hypothetical protein n=1 Tax=Bursaphelenchus xylophilus TaxID=6326 RepID=A0A1I7SBU6_BURXY|nr:unnamed protein product [Bursaphelenchus xylophilus]CAG9113010.1 unnamed protein product [Bursaphelenchus xylophilus]